MENAWAGTTSTAIFIYINVNFKYAGLAYLDSSNPGGSKKAVYCVRTENTEHVSNVEFLISENIERLSCLGSLGTRINGETTW